MIKKENDETVYWMNKHLDEYLIFYNVCRDKEHIDEEEIPMLWKSWCVVSRGG